MAALKNRHTVAVWFSPVIREWPEGQQLPLLPSAERPSSRCSSSVGRLEEGDRSVAMRHEDSMDMPDCDAGGRLRKEGTSNNQHRERKEKRDEKSDQRARVPPATFFPSRASVSGVDV